MENHYPLFTDKFLVRERAQLDVQKANLAVQHRKEDLRKHEMYIDLAFNQLGLTRGQAIARLIKLGIFAHNRAWPLRQIALHLCSNFVPFGIGE